MKNRNIGNNYALAWKTGENTHMTLVYMNYVKRGFEQERVKELVEEYLENEKFPETLILVLGEMITERCVAVMNPEVAALQEGLRNYLISKGYDLRANTSAHIDLRGQEISTCVNTVVNTREWNY